jgi:hypothetical protein
MHSSAYPVMYSGQPPLPQQSGLLQLPAPPVPAPTYSTPYTYDHAAMLHAATSAAPLYQPPDWIVDSGASSHVTGKTGNLTTTHSAPELNSHHIIVGNGSKLPILVVGSVQISSLPLYLQNVLVSPGIVKNLISVRQFTLDNYVSIEFDPFGFSVKDLATKTLLLRSNSDGDLYPFFGTKTPPAAAFSTTTGDLWHRRLGHPSSTTLSHLPLDFLDSCNNNSTRSSPLCESCQLGHHTRLPFPTSSSFTTAAFQLVHCDLWTSPVVSFSGYKYYLVVLDDLSYYSWTFPLRSKSDTCITIQHFFKFVQTQFHVTISCMQCDNGGEFLTNVLLLRFLLRRSR